MSQTWAATVYVLGEGDIVHWVTGDAVIGDAWEAQGGAFWQEARFVDDPEYNGPTGDDDQEEDCAHPECPVAGCEEASTQTV
jgi:hypothetical protein